jgi:hypothetical protein
MTGRGDFRAFFCAARGLGHPGLVGMAVAIRDEWERWTIIGAEGRRQELFPPKDAFVVGLARDVRSRTLGLVLLHEDFATLELVSRSTGRKLRSVPAPVTQVVVSPAGGRLATITASEELSVISIDADLELMKLRSRVPR